MKWKGKQMKSNFIFATVVNTSFSRKVTWCRRSRIGAGNPSPFTTTTWWWLCWRCSPSRPAKAGHKFCRTRWRPRTRTRAPSKIFALRCPFFTSFTSSSFRSSSSTSSWPWLSSHFRSRERLNYRMVKLTRIRWFSAINHFFICIEFVC